MPESKGRRRARWRPGCASGSRACRTTWRTWCRKPCWFAAFDTRVTRVRRLPGSAAHSAARAGRRHGFSQAIAPQSFYVLDVEGPLADGELEHARVWGAAVAASVPTTV